MTQWLFCRLLFFGFAVPGLLNARTPEEPKTMVYKKKHVVGLSISDFFVGGLDLNYDRRIGSTPQWMRFNVTGYYLKSGDDYYGYENMLSGFDPFDEYKGFRLGAGYKYFPFRYEFFYVSGGVSYQYFKVRYQTYDYIPFIEDGMTFYYYQYGSKKSDFNKLGANACIGIQSTMRHVFHINVYMGIGYAHSIHNARKGVFNDDGFGFGHTGSTFMFGFRFGWAFGKVEQESR